MSESHAKVEDDLFKRSLRMIVVLVGACVLFVGVASLGTLLFSTRMFASPAEAKEPLVTNKQPLSI
jgi:hypothetical protein